MSKSNTLEKYSDQFVHCLHCKLCGFSNWFHLPDEKWLDNKWVCPTASRFGYESFYAAGRIELARAFVEGTIKEATPRLLDVLYTCTGCGACKEQCHELSGVNLDHIELFESMKAYIVSKGWGPLPKHEKFAKSIYEKHNPYNESHEDRFNWLADEIKSDGEILYYVGCTSSYRQQNIAKATIKVLKASGIKFQVLGSDEWCCGSTLIRTGQIDKIKELAEHNIESIKSKGIKTVIFSCAGCYRTFKEDYPKLGFKLPFKVRHTTQYFLDLIRKDKLKLKSLPIDVTYHDPCHLGRHANVYKQPRKILSKIVKFHEMPRNMTDAFCCGAGSGVRAGYPDFSKWVCKNRLDEVNDIGVKMLVSACPFCENNFKETIADCADLDIEVKDISEILENALETQD